MKPRAKLFLILGAALLVAVLSTLVGLRKRQALPGTASARLLALLADPKARPDSGPFLDVLQEALVGYRQVLVLYADERDFKDGEKAAVDRVGFALYHENQSRQDLLDRALEALAAGTHKARFTAMEDVLDWVETGPGLYDADRLAFRENLRTLQAAVARDTALPAVKLHKRITEDLSALGEIEALYDKELRAVFGRFGERGIQVQRQRWDEYVARIKALQSRDKILRDHGTIIPYAQGPDLDREITGKGLPPKTLVLTFDDGPHGVYTDEIAAILKQYGVPGLFFELGQNLGSLDPEGKARLGRLALVSRKLLDAGHLIGNHSFSHADFSKQDDGVLRDEVGRTDTLLKALHGDGSRLFRFPYGARRSATLGTLESLHLRSMLWTIDSRDWADPVPNSIVERVLRDIKTEQRGIVLFHDINERTVKALPRILDELVAEGYRFAAWDGSDFKVGETVVTAGARAVPTTGYREGWALVVGIDDYPKMPKLQYATGDAEAIRQTLVERFGFAKDKVILLKNQEATRTGILGVLNGRFAKEDVKRDDRILVFFAGHGTTRKLSSGRDLGYLVPWDGDPNDTASTSISMTELQDLGEALPAKHVFFIIDACYSGLGLTRGAPSQNFLKENARRLGRQMLTAGGADQVVADGGPGGHSIFTWTLLQALAGKADLNGDGFITGTELAAYLSPAVASVSRQTPAFGSLPGSEGGEFVFELPVETEFLSPDTRQLEGPAAALAKKLEHVQAAPVLVKTLDGGEAKLAPGKPVALPPRNAAQRANDRALLMFREHRYSEAEALFAEALKLRPDFALAANNLGFVYFKQDKFKEAVLWFEAALRMDPGRAVAYYNLADAHARLGDKEKARKAYETYLELSPKGQDAKRAKEELRSL